MKKYKRYSDEKLKKLIICQAIEIYNLEGRLNISRLNCETSGRYRKFFGSTEELIKEAGLPSYAVFGEGKCKLCDKAFDKKVANSLFCRVEHEKAYRGERLRQKRANKERECKNCQKSFAKNQSGEVSYCSIECKQEDRRKKVKKVLKNRKVSCELVTAKYTFKQIADRDGMSCAHCGMETTKGGDHLSWSYANIDHIIPVSKGGADALFNVQILCKKCNTKKSNKLFPIDIARAKKLMPDNVTDYFKEEELRNDSGLMITNRSGVTGVCWDKSCDKWKAQIVVDGVSIYLDSQRDKATAIEIRKYAERLVENGETVKDIKRKVSKYRRDRKAGMVEPFRFQGVG